MSKKLKFEDPQSQELLVRMIHATRNMIHAIKSHEILYQLLEEERQAITVPLERAHGAMVNAARTLRVPRNVLDNLDLEPDDDTP